MTQITSHIASRLLFGILKGLSYLPLSLLHGVASVVVRLILLSGGYRRHMVLANLQKCFPSAEPGQIQKWTHEYYRFLTDMFVETIKSISIPGKELDKRMALLNEAEASEWLSKEGGIVLASHYGNFEWMSQRVDRFMHKHGKRTAGVYARLSPSFLEQVMIRLRSRWGAVMIRRHQAIRDSIRLLREGVIVGFVIDQSPAINAPALNHSLLGTDTRWIIGATKLALRAGGPILFAKVRRVARGKYSLELLRLNEPDEKSLTEQEILARYVGQLEQSILEAPPYWLWSHNRWKG